MKKFAPSQTHLMPLALAAGLMVFPLAATAQRDGTPGNPPGTAAGRALDNATGTPTTPDGTPGNPAGTAVGRALDRATGTPTTPDGTPGNPPGTALGRATTPATPGTAAGTTAGTTAGTPLAAPLGSPPAGATTSLATAGSAVLMRPRLSQIIGGNIYNDRNERIGEVDDILLTQPTAMAGSTTAGPIAVLQIGGFLGMGGRLVAVPLGDLRWNTERSHMVMPGASKESLQSRSVFDYDSVRSR